MLMLDSRYMKNEINVTLESLIDIVDFDVSSVSDKFKGRDPNKVIRVCVDCDDKELLIATLNNIKKELYIGFDYNILVLGAKNYYLANEKVDIRFPDNGYLNVFTIQAYNYEEVDKEIDELIYTLTRRIDNNYRLRVLVKID